MKIIASWKCAALGVALALAPVAAAAQEVDLSPEMQAAVEEAEALGLLLYRYDQAAWHGTDAFLEQFNESRDGEMVRGYIVVPGEDDLLDAVFFGEVDGELVEVARFGVEGSQVTRRAYHSPDARPALSPLATRLAQARQIAIQAAIEERIGLCADAAPNTIALPPAQDGSIDVYLLTPPLQNDRYPLGGHFKFEIAADDSVTGWRRFMNTCFDVTIPVEGAGGDQPIVAGITHLLDPQPTEIHFFATSYMGLPLHVVTTDNRIVWELADGELVGAQPLGD